MFQLDLRTIIFGNFLYSTAISFFLLMMVLWKKAPLPGLRNWTWGYILICLNYLLMFIISLNPDSWLMAAPHVLSVLGLILIKNGMARFYESRKYRGMDLLILSVSLAAFFTASQFDLRLVLFIMPLSVMAVLLLTQWMLRGNPSSWYIQLFYSLANITQMIRLFLGLLIPPGADISEAGSKPALISIFFFFTQLLIALSMVFVTIERFIREQDEMLGRMKNLSLRDELTGLLNRRGFKDHYEGEEKRARRYQSDLSLAIGDIDDFKRINDTFGHQCGDRVLLEVAQTMDKALREVDTLARWGGEEFILLLPDTNRESAEISLERIRKAVEDLEIPFQDMTLSVSISIGYHSSRRGILHVDHFLKRADKNLYEAKAAGKNRVVGSES